MRGRRGRGRVGSRFLILLVLNDNTTVCIVGFMIFCCILPFTLSMIGGFLDSLRVVSNMFEPVQMTS